MFHLGLQLAAAYWANVYDGMSSCKHQYVDLISYFAYALVGLNLISLIIVRCASKFPRVYFFLTYFLDLLLIGGTITLSVVGYHQYRNCSSNYVIFSFSAIEALIAVVISLLIICCNLSWGQRYSNSPGNIVWAILFLHKVWPGNYYLPLLIIGIAYAAISLSSLFVNFMTCNSLSSMTKKIVYGQWIFSILVMIAAEIYAAIFYFTQAKAPTDFIEDQARKLLAVFIIVNIIDLLFWIWGMKTLAYENGDRVRDDLFAG